MGVIELEEGWVKFKRGGLIDGLVIVLIIQIIWLKMELI
jgi:intracellular septation protein A